MKFGNRADSYIDADESFRWGLVMFIIAIVITLACVFTTGFPGVAVSDSIERIENCPAERANAVQCEEYWCLWCYEDNGDCPYVFITSNGDVIESGELPCVFLMYNPCEGE